MPSWHCQKYMAQCSMYINNNSYNLSFHRKDMFDYKQCEYKHYFIILLGSEFKILLICS